jgi:hypothetical protein
VPIHPKGLEVDMVGQISAALAGDR